MLPKTPSSSRIMLVNECAWRASDKEKFIFLNWSFSCSNYKRRLKIFDMIFSHCHQKKTKVVSSSLKNKTKTFKVQFVVQSLSHVWFYNPMDCSTPGFPVLHHLLKFAQTHVHWVNDAIQSSHLLSPASPPALNLSQHQGLFQWISSSHKVAKVLEFQLQHQSFQWIFRVDFL